MQRSDCDRFNHEADQRMRSLDSTNIQRDILSRGHGAKAGSAPVCANSPHCVSNIAPSILKSHPNLNRTVRMSRQSRQTYQSAVRTQYDDYHQNTGALLAQSLLRSRLSQFRYVLFPLNSDKSREHAVWMFSAHL